MLSFEFIVPHTHPCLEGHFPDNPVVPGVVILDEVIRGVLAENSTIKINNIPSLKFLKPLKPDITVRVNVNEKKSGLLQFICLINESTFVSGQLRIQQADIP